MNPELSVTVSKVINDMASAIGTTAEHLWPILVRQSYIESIQGAVQIALSVLLTWFVSANLPKWWAWSKEDFNEPGVVIACVVIGVVAVALFVIGIDQIWHATNPEYYAAQKILDAVSKK